MKNKKIICFIVLFPFYLFWLFFQCKAIRLFLNACCSSWIAFFPFDSPWLFFVILIELNSNKLWNKSLNQGQWKTMFEINSKGLLTCLIVWISLHSLIRRKEKKKRRRRGRFDFEKVIIEFVSNNYDFDIILLQINWISK